ncbi:MAG: hypothetical protein V2A70_01850 [Candidatus Omnitrophota bacterium]
MGLNIFQVVDPLLGLVVNVLIQMTVFKFDHRRRLLRSIIIGFMAGLAVISIVDPFIFFMSHKPLLERAAVVLVHLMTYGFLGYCYFHFINMGETARRIRLLRELYDAPEGLTQAEILFRYNAKEMVRMRLDRLLNTHQIVLRDERLYIASHVMLLMSKGVLWMKTLILGKKQCS